MNNELRREVFEKIMFLQKSFSIGHLSAFSDWLEEKGFQTQKYKEILLICSKGEFTHKMEHDTLVIRTKVNRISLLKDGKVKIIKYKGSKHGTPAPHNGTSFSFPILPT